MSQQIIFGNNASSSLAGAITNTATTALLASGTGILFPTPSAGEYFVMSFTDQATGLLNEIVWVTNITGDEVTMVRGQEGTTPLAWQAGDFCSNRWTAGQAAAMVQFVEYQPTRIITASGAFTMTNSDAVIGLNRSTSLAESSTVLPSNPNPNQLFTILDLAGNLQAYPCLVQAPATFSIAGLAEFMMNVNRQNISFRYFGSNLYSLES